MWPELEQLGTRHELRLSGTTISKRLTEDGELDKALFSLTQLNFLSINNTCLISLQPELELLCNLTNLDLSCNELTALPSSLGALIKLKYLDVSNNKLTALPEEFVNLEHLESVNASQNCLESVPCVISLQQLHYLVLAGNQLNVLPEGISELPLLLELKAAKNQLCQIPDDLHELPLLRLLDLADNQITEVPPELCQCPKLRDLDLKGNKIKDRRLKKMLEQSPTKSVLEYLKGILAKQASKEPKKKKKAAKGESKPKPEVPRDTVVIHRSADYIVQMEEAISETRPYIVCCIMRGLNLSRKNALKKFLSAQTKLHEGLCQKRQVATIATHDLRHIRQPLVYTAQSPEQMKIWPLGRHEEMSARGLVEQLTAEADAVRKEKKRATFTGIHKYLDLVLDKPTYACLCDGEERRVISFPPITNSHPTKISAETTDLLVEVTSPSRQEVCKRVMDALVHEALTLGLPDDANDLDKGLEEMTLQAAEGGEPGAEDLEVEFSSAAAPSARRLHLTQVRVLDPSGGLKVVYPDRNDLTHIGPDVCVERDV